MLMAPRGTRDLLPEEARKWQYVEATARSLFQMYQYREIRTPIFEFTELFSRGIGETTDIVEKEMYTFQDKGGRSLTLRPEGTAPVVRAYLENKLYQNPLVKLYYIGPIFRYERPQAGRFRQAHQIGVEAIGSIHPSLDAEVISLGMDFFRSLGLGHLSVKINSIGCPVCRARYRPLLAEYLQRSLPVLCTDCQRRALANPIRVFDCKKAQCQEICSQAPLTIDHLCSGGGNSCSEHFKAVKEHLDLLGVAYEVDRQMVRGLDYYTKTVFEVISLALGAQNSLVGGGRYDALVEELGGSPKPAVGFALGLERTVMVMEQCQAFAPNSGAVQVYLAGLGEAAGKELFTLLSLLRSRGIAGEKDYLSRSLSAQMKEAHRLGARYTVILGEEEMKRSVAILRDMESGAQEEVPMALLPEAVARKAEGSNG